MARATSSGSMMDGTSPANMSPSGATVSGRRSFQRAGGTRKKKGPQHAPNRRGGVFTRDGIHVYVTREKKGLQHAP